MMTQKAESDFNSLDSETKIVIAVTYAQKNAELNGTLGYSGTTEPEIGELLEKMGSKLSEDEIATALKNNIRNGQVVEGIRPVGKKTIPTYQIPHGPLKEKFEEHLHSLKWLELKRF